MRASVFKPRSVYIYKVAKSLGFRFGKEKNKTKPIDFAKCVAESNRLSAALLAIA